MNMVNDWWQPRKEELLTIAGDACPIYVYNEETLNETLFDLLSINALDLLSYPVHLNPHPKILRKAFEMGVGFTCISIDEITRVLNRFPRFSPQRILFVAGHAPDNDLERAFDTGAHVVVDDLNILKRSPGIFQDRDICIRLPLQDLNETISFLTGISKHFPEVSTLIFGNRMDGSANHGKEMMDISGLGDYLETIKDACPQYRLWLELPDVMVSHAGVLLAEATEAGEEEGTRYIRIDMDMKGRVYDGLRNVSHQVINLVKRDDEERVIKTRIIGQGKAPEDTMDFMEAPAYVEKGDILLFTNMGAYEPGREFDKKGRGPAPEYYMHARSMCQVKI